MELKKITGFISEQTDEELNDYAKKNNKLKMGLIGEIITNFIKGENNGNSEETSSKEKTGNKKK